MVRGWQGVRLERHGAAWPLVRGIRDPKASLGLCFEERGVACGACERLRRRLRGQRHQAFGQQEAQGASTHQAPMLACRLSTCSFRFGASDPDYLPECKDESHPGARKFKLELMNKEAESLDDENPCKLLDETGFGHRFEIIGCDGQSFAEERLRQGPEEPGDG